VGELRPGRGEIGEALGGRGGLKKGWGGPTKKKKNCHYVKQLKEKKSWILMALKNQSVGRGTEKEKKKWGKKMHVQGTKKKKRLEFLKNYFKTITEAAIKTKEKTSQTTRKKQCQKTPSLKPQDAKSRDMKTSTIQQSQKSALPVYNEEI